MKKIIYILIIANCAFSAISYSQQLPYYTQFTTNAFLLNPAVAGTRGTVNTCAGYRMQWVGYEDAPRTSSISLHSRMFKGKMGAGAYLMQDKVGPSQQTNIGASYAYHIRFPDCELSAGLSGNYTKYTLIGTKMLLHNTQDPSINQTVSNTAGATDVNAGIYLYNDRFHIGVSGLHLLQAKTEFYKEDSVKKGVIKYASQIYSTLGYNYSQHPDYVFENSLFVNYLAGVPLMIDYTLRVHYKQKLLTGISVRLRDAIAIHLGATLMENFQVSYSYDILINKFRNYSGGSHEIMLKYNFNKPYNDKNGPRVSKFAHQKYGNMF
ncbi:MAG: type IX secretion system membrane protein PorP/SprF [Bacteroidota bacterium]